METGPYTDGGDGEEEEEDEGVERTDEGAGAGCVEDVDGGDHGSNDEMWGGDGTGGKYGDGDVEPEGEGDGPEEGVPILEVVEDGVAEEAEDDNEGRFFITRKPAVGDADDDKADRNQE